MATKIHDFYFKIDLIDSMEGTPIEETPPGSSRTFQFTALSEDYEYCLKYPENPITQKYVNTCVNCALAILKEQLPAIPTTLFTLSQRQIEQMKEQVVSRYSEAFSSVGLRFAQQEKVEAIHSIVQDTTKNVQDALDSDAETLLRWAIHSIDENFSFAIKLCSFAQEDDFKSKDGVFGKEESLKWTEKASDHLFYHPGEFELNEKHKKIKSTLEAITQKSYQSQYMQNAKNAEKDIQQLPSSQKRSNHYCHYIAAAVVTLVSVYFAYAYSSP